ncbi:MAG: bifunctional DNA-formamidopyrimidine glycosylase/DNA-(apurinic or apyrimidinic site) lyase [Verrucomicrobiota bacterium]|jgi:formamidopyrimidine-DNA glycosylase
MPELPEVEVLARHLRPLLRGKIIRNVNVRRKKVLKPTSLRKFRRTLLGAKFTDLSRRGKYLLFQLRSKNSDKHVTLLGHLGMTGRMFLASKGEPLPKHAAVIFDLGRENFVYEDTRYFGRLTLDVSAVEKLGSEPLSKDFQLVNFARSLKRSHQAVKIKLLDQSLVSGIGNIYASEALFCAHISPKLAANRLSFSQVKKLWRAIRKVLTEAIDCGSTVPLNFHAGETDGVFYFGRAPGTPDYYEERLRVYDRAGRPCVNCHRPVKRIVQAARSTFYCAHCQLAE